MIYIKDVEVTDLFGHGISEVQVIGAAGKYI